MHTLSQSNQFQYGFLQTSALVTESKESFVKVTVKVSIALTGQTRRELHDLISRTTLSLNKLRKLTCPRRFPEYDNSTNVVTLGSDILKKDARCELSSGEQHRA